MQSCLGSTSTVLVAAFLTLAPAAAGERALTVRDVHALRSVTEVAISPEGLLIAYVLRVPRDLTREKDGPDWAELHVVDLAGRSRPFLAGSVRVQGVAWVGGLDAEGPRQLSFLAKRDDDEHRALYVISAEGGEARRLISLGEDIETAVWHPAGSHVAVIASEPVPEAEKAKVEKGFDAEVFEESLRSPRLGIVARDGGEPRWLDLPGTPSDPVWSPDGSKIALALAPTPSVDDSLMKRRVRVVDVETGEVVGALENAGKLGPLVWSPDGQRLAAIAAADQLERPLPRSPLRGIRGGEQFPGRTAATPRAYPRGRLGR